MHPEPESSRPRFWVESDVNGNADSLLKRATTTSPTGTLNDLTNVYIPLSISCVRGYLHSFDHLMMMTYTLILGDFNAHHVVWHSSSTDTRDNMLENTIS